MFYSCTKIKKSFFLQVLHLFVTQCPCPTDWIPAPGWLWTPRACSPLCLLTSSWRPRSCPTPRLSTKCCYLAACTTRSSRQGTPREDTGHWIEAARRYHILHCNDNVKFSMCWCDLFFANWTTARPSYLWKKIQETGARGVDSAKAKKEERKQKKRHCLFGAHMGLGVKGLETIFRKKLCHHLFSAFGLCLWRRAWTTLFCPPPSVKWPPLCWLTAGRWSHNKVGGQQRHWTLDLFSSWLDCPPPPGSFPSWMVK